MAERTIGLRIELNGFSGIVTSIKQLETELAKAKEVLKGLDIGSEEFKNLSEQISKAEGQLIKLNDAAKGLGLEQKLEGFSKFAGGVTASFAAATAAVSLFGGESEDVSKAAAKAQSLLTIALSARSIQETILGAKIIAKTIAEKASVLATNAANTATKAFYATIAANPIGALVAVIGLAVTAMFAFGEETKETEEAVKSLADRQLESAQASVQQRERLILLKEILNDTNASLKQKKAAYEELKKIIPEYNDVEYEQIKNQEELNKLIEREIQLIDLRAEAKALEDALVDQKKAELERQRNIQRGKDLENLVKLQEEYARAAAGGFQGTFEQYQAQVNLLRGVGQQLQGNGQQITENTTLSGQLAAIQKKIFELQGQTTTETKKTAAAKKEIERIDVIALDNLRKQNAEIAKLKELLNIVSKFEPISEPVIVPLLETRISEIKTELDAALPFLNTELTQSAKKVSELFFGIDTSLTETQQNIIEQGDEFKKYFEIIKNNILDGKKALESIGELPTFFSPEQKRDLIAFGTQFERTVTEGTKLLEKYYDKQNILALGFLDNQVREEFVRKAQIDGLVKYQELQQKINEGTLTEGERLLAVQESVRKSLLQNFKALEGTYDGTTQLLQNFVDAYSQILAPEKFNQLVKENQAAADESEKLISDLTSSILTNIETNGKFALSIEQQAEIIAELQKEYTKYLIELQNFQTKLKDIINSGDLERFEYLLKQFGGAEVVLTSFVNSFKEWEAFLGDDFAPTIDKVLGSFSKGLRGLSRQQLIDKRDFIKNYQKELRDASPELADATNETFEAIGKEIQWDLFFVNLAEALQLFQVTMNRISSLVRERASFELEALAKTNEKALAQVVGDTEEANQKRLELTQQYETRKAKIEKEARLKALQFSKAQAIASLAEAINATLPQFALNPVGAGILIGIETALATTQIALIQDQINLVKSFRRGGMLASGGILSGPSHENGGITFGQLGLQLEGNEAVISRGATLNYAGLLSQINQSGGGRPLVVSSPMDSRLIEVLAKERQTPIRAYVMEQDITKAQTVNRKLEQLATL